MEEEEDEIPDLSKADSFPLRSSHQDLNATASRKPSKNGDASRSHLSFRNSVSQVSMGGSKTQINLVDRQYVKNPSQVFQQAIPIRDSSRALYDRPGFDHSTSRRIIQIISILGYIAAVGGCLVQLIACMNNTLNWKWGIGFWSAGVFVFHATVGVLTLYRKLNVRLRSSIAKFYLFACAVLAGCCILEMTLCIHTYNTASDLLGNSTHTGYEVEAEDVSISSSMLAGFALLGILLGIFGVSVSLQRLDLDAALGRSLTRLTSRRSSLIAASNSQTVRLTKVQGADDGD